LKHGHVIPISFNFNLNNSTSTSGSRSISDLFPEHGTSDSSVVGQARLGSMKMDDKDVGNGKAPFDNEGEEEVHKEVHKEVQEEVQKEVQEEEPEVGKGKWGSVEMVTYNSLTVDPVLGKFCTSSFFYPSIWLGLDIIQKLLRLIPNVSPVDAGDHRGDHRLPFGRTASHRLARRYTEIRGRDGRTGKDYSGVGSSEEAAVRGSVSSGGQ
jgi:hypothetical protein